MEVQTIKTKAIKTKAIKTKAIKNRAIKNNTALLLIFSMTLIPFVCAWALTSNYFSGALSQKQYGEFLEHTQFLSFTHDEHVNNSPSINKNVWHIVANANNKIILEKLKKIKTALGKKSSLVDIITTTDLPAAAYIATPEGQLLLRYKRSDIGKPFYHDLKHLLRSNTK